MELIVDKWQITEYNMDNWHYKATTMLLQTRVFELCNNDYWNLSELAKAMGISISQVYRVRNGERHINEKFIIGAIKAFPDRKLDDLFHLVPDSPIDKQPTIRKQKKA